MYCKAINLDEDMTYYFSVTAENKIGKGETTEISEGVTTKKGLCKYIYRTYHFHACLTDKILYPVNCTENIGKRN